MPPDWTNNKEMSKKAKGYVAGILAAIFYGTNPLGSLALYADGFGAGAVLFYRYALAVVAFAVIMAVRGETFRIGRGQAIRMSVLGAFFAMSSMMLYMSFKYMDAGVASTILFSYPIMTAVLMVALYHERITWTTTLSIALAVGGIALLYRGGGGATLSTIGVALVMLSSLLYAFYIIATGQTHTGFSPVRFTFWVLVFGCLSVVVWLLVTGERVPMLHGVKQWACALQLALLPTVLSIFFINIAIDNIGSTPSAILGALEPVTAVFIGCMVYGESFTLRLAIGIALILGGVILIVLRK